MRSFGACDLAMYLYAEACKLRDASLSWSWECITYSATCKMKRFAFYGLVHPNGVFCATQAMYRRSPLSPDRVNRLHRGASMPEVVVHTAGCTEKVLAVAVTVPVHGTESLDRLTTYWTGARHGRKGCCTSDLPMQLGGELYATCTRTPVSSSLPREVLAAAVVVQPLCGNIYD